MGERMFNAKRMVSRLFAGGTANRVVGTTDGQNMTMLQIVDAMVAAGAGIAQSKLATLSIGDANVAAGAGIAQSKLATLSIGDANVAVGGLSLNRVSSTGQLLRLIHSSTLGAPAGSFATGVISNTASYRQIFFEITGNFSATMAAGSQVYMQMYDTGGAAVQNTHSGHYYVVKGGVAIPTPTAQPLTYWIVTVDNVEGAAWGFTLRGEIDNMHSSPKLLRSRMVYRSAADALGRVAVSEVMHYGNANTMAQLLFSNTGGVNIAAGSTFKVWGVPNAA